MSKQTQRLEAARHDGYELAMKCQRIYGRYDNFSAAYRTAFKRGYVEGIMELLKTDSEVREWLVNNPDLAPKIGLSHRQAEPIIAELKARYKL